MWFLLVMEPGLEPEPENPGLCIKFGTRVFKIKTRETRVSTFFEKPGKMQYFLIAKFVFLNPHLASLRRVMSFRVLLGSKEDSIKAEIKAKCKNPRSG